MPRLLSELRRRSVFRVGATYLVVGWILIQLAALLEGSLGLPEWFDAVVIGFLGLGFPIALILAWAFEVTPEGIRKTEPAQADTGFQKPGIADFAIIALLVIVLGATGFQILSRGSNNAGQTNVAAIPQGENTSIAVLPFVNMSGEDSQEYFSDGMTEEIINALVRVPDLAVAARTSVFAFKGTNEDIRSIGSQLGVSHVLEGSVRMTEGNLRVTAQLIDVGTGFHLWSENYDRPEDNIFIVQEAIANAIAGRLIEGFGGEETVPNRTANIDAYDHFLRGSAALRERSLSDAIAAFRQAIDADPDFAPAWASLAIALQIDDEPDEGLEAGNRALELDPDNVHAMTAIASIHRMRHNWLEAESIFRRAMVIDSGSSELIEDYAEFLYYVGKLDQSLEISSRGYELDPYMRPLAIIYASALMSTGEQDAAMDIVNRRMERGFFLDLWEMQAHVINNDLDALNTVLDRIRVVAEAGMAQANDPDELPGWQAGLDLLDDIQIVFNDPENANSRERLRQALINDVPGFPNLLMQFAGMHAGLEREVIIHMTPDEGEIIRSVASFWETPFAGLWAMPEFHALVEMARLPEYWRIAGWPDQCRPIGTDDFTCFSDGAE